MGWLAGRFGFRRKSKNPRPKKEMVPVPFARREVSGWKVLDAQLVLEHWLRSNGIR